MQHRMKTIIEETVNDSDVMEISQVKFIDHKWSIIETLYNGALQSKDSSEDDINNFRSKINDKIKAAKSEHSYAQELLKYNGKITLEIPNQIDPKHMKYIFKMRNELILERDDDVLMNTIDMMLYIYPSLKFKNNQNSDIFFNLESGKSKHVVMSKDYLFAINLAIQMHHMKFFKDNKKYFCPDHHPESYKQHRVLSAFKTCLKLNPTIMMILSVIDLEVNSSNEITDIVIKHENETFGCGLRGGGTLSIKPCFAFGKNPNQIASVFSVFDQLSAFKWITHINAVCHEKMRLNLQYFYQYLITLLPEIVSINLEESMFNEYIKKDDYYIGQTILNPVLDQILRPDSIIRDRITYLSIVGYDILSEDNLTTLRNMSLKSLGLFGKFQYDDFCYAYVLLNAPCRMIRHLEEFKTGPEVHSLVNMFLFQNDPEYLKLLQNFTCKPNDECRAMIDEFWAKKQLKCLKFYMGHQNYTIPEDPFKLKKSIIEEVKKYFKKNNFAKGLIENKERRVFHKIGVIYRYHYYMVDDTSNNEKIIMKEHKSRYVGGYTGYIFENFKAKTLYLETEFYNEAEENIPAVDEIIFNTSGIKNFNEKYLNDSLKVLNHENGHLAVCYRINTNDRTTELKEVQGRLLDLFEVFKRTVNIYSKNKLKLTLQIQTPRALTEETKVGLFNIINESIVAMNQRGFTFKISNMPVERASEHSIENIQFE
ncbi:hypothetical protein ENBRE01_2359 [Enteropsectra breve]|nr:hypothetical protein ENBRE01_2359 [Enteropsectra breve]